MTQFRMIMKITIKKKPADAENSKHTRRVTTMMMIKRKEINNSLKIAVNAHALINILHIIAM